MKCPTDKCPNMLADRSRRLYCPACRASMARIASKTAKELRIAEAAAEKRMYRLGHFASRKTDQRYVK